MLRKVEVQVDGRVAPGNCTPRPSRNRAWASRLTRLLRFKRADALSATTEQFLPLPVDRSDRGVNRLSPSLHGHYPASSLLRDSPPLRIRIRTVALVGLPLAASPLASESQVPTFHSTASWQAQATSHAGRRSARKQVSSELIPQ